MLLRRRLCRSICKSRCALKQGWLSSDVEAGVLSRLADAKQADGTPGFFYADCFTFGTPLFTAAILKRRFRAWHGGEGSTPTWSIGITRREQTVFQPLPEVTCSLDRTGEILRVANDPNFPERGSIRVTAEGGR